MTRGAAFPAIAFPAASAVRRLALFACLYWLLDWVSYIYPMPRFNITPWNPQPALAIALLTLQGTRWLPAVVCVVFVSEQLIRDTPTSWLIDGVVALVLGLCYGGIARLLAAAAVSPQLATTRDVLRLIGVVVAGTLLTGLLYVGALVAAGVGAPADFPEALLRFWIGDSVGILVFLPLALMLADPARRERLRASFRRPIALAQGAAIVAVLVFVFGQGLVEQVKFFYLLFLPLVWISAQSGLPGSAVAALIIQTGIIIAVHFTGQPALTVFEFQTFLIALTIVGLFLGATVDERARAEAALRRSQKLAAAGQMAAALTHELNQPLTALANYARAGQLLVLAGEREQARLEETMEKLVAESRRTADVVRRLRDFLQHGALRLAPVDLAVLAAGVVDSLRTAAAGQGVALREELPRDLPPVLADALQIEIVLRNLLRNAIEAAREGGAAAPAVDLRLALGAGEVVLTVRDNGPGVTAEQREQIFEPFETTKASGMGMGLAVSRAIVEAHQGRLEADCGAGGLFRLVLPAGEEET